MWLHQQLEIHIPLRFFSFLADKLLPSVPKDKENISSIINKTWQIRRVKNLTARKLYRESLTGGVCMSLLLLAILCAAISLFLPEGLV